MNIVILSLILLCLININTNLSMNNHGIVIKNKFLKFILFNDRKNMQLLKQANNFYKICYNKSLSSIIQGVTEYNNLSEEEKELIEAVISLCY